MTEPLLRVDELVKHYRLPRESLLRPAPVIEALRGVSFVLHAGRSLGIVGESGSGKSTLARQVMALEAPTSGTVRLLGRDLNAVDGRELVDARRDFQIVFQDPYGSLDPRQRIGRVVAEPLHRLAAANAAERVAEALEAVGLRASDARKYAHEFSGGQRQRIAIARALITRPKLIVADEPVSALDVSVQAQVLNLFADLEQQFGVTYLFISHDLAVVDHVCSEVAVMFAGRIVEQGSTDLLFGAPAHPYTRALITAMPVAVAAPTTKLGTKSVRVPIDTELDTDPDPDTDSDPDFAPLPANAPNACSFAARCGFRQALCTSQPPPLRPIGGGRLAACHFAESVMNERPASGESR